MCRCFFCENVVFWRVILCYWVRCDVFSAPFVYAMLFGFQFVSSFRAGHRCAGQLMSGSFSEKCARQQAKMA